mgnify:CR=1 FL=1
MVANNKNLQKKLELTLDSFKNLKGVYLVRQRDTFRLEDFDYLYTINKDYIVFKGKYVEGRKEGHGIEFYFNRRKKFEGSYSKGIKVNGTGYDKFGNEIYTIDNNIVTEKYKNGNRVFKGSYYNGKKWTGVGYDINGNVAYNIKCGKGFVKEFFDDGVLKFEGEYDNGERNGKGKRYDYENKEVLFEGEYLNGEKWNGKGKEYYLDQDEIDDVEEFKIKFDPFNQKPKKKKGGLFSGGNLFGFNFGREEPDPDPFMHYIYSNAFKNKNLTRVTKKIFGNTYEEKILKYEGEYLNGERHGKGKEYNKEQSLIYEGEYKNGFWDGYGKQYKDEGMFSIGKEPKLLYEGEFKDGKKNGKGIEYDIGLSSYRILHEGFFRDNHFVG